MQSWLAMKCIPSIDRFKNRRFAGYFTQCAPYLAQSNPRIEVVTNFPNPTPVSKIRKISYKP
jgi:hypothetical protein